MILSPLIYVTKKFNSSQNFKSITKIMAKMRKQFSKIKYSQKKRHCRIEFILNGRGATQMSLKSNVQHNSMAKSTIEGVPLTKLSSKSSNPNGHG